jgi:hypothetical protein
MFGTEPCPKHSHAPCTMLRSMRHAACAHTLHMLSGPAPSNKDESQRCMGAPCDPPSRARLVNGSRSGPSPGSNVLASMSSFDARLILSIYDAFERRSRAGRFSRCTLGITLCTSCIAPPTLPAPYYTAYYAVGLIRCIIRRIGGQYGRIVQLCQGQLLWPSSRPVGGLIVRDGPSFKGFFTHEHTCDILKCPPYIRCRVQGASQWYVVCSCSL